MTKLERLAQIIGLPIEVVEREVDKGMWDVIIELNDKGYRTIGCCEGHLNNKNQWNGYIGFAYPYKFNVYPKNFSSMKRRIFFYWDGKDEESRQKFLSELLDWAKTLPYKAPIEKRAYTLYGKSKTRANSKEKIIMSTNNYEDIKAILNRRDISKYNLRLVESVVERY